MPFCSICRFRLEEDNLFCPNCGNKVREDNEPETVLETPSMTKEESIALAGKLREEYHNLERIKKEIDDNKVITSKPVPSPKYHAAFKFFWPYLIASVVSANVIIILGYFIYLATGSEAINLLFSLAGIIALVVILIVGGKTATSKRDMLNNQMLKNLQMMRRKHADLTEKNRTLQSLYSAKKRVLDEYNGMVPSRFRTSRHMDRVKALLQTNKAENFSEAVAQLMRE